MTDEQIIKGLECCADESVEICNECPYFVDTFTCNQMQMRKDALDLINRQKAEIERRKNNLFCKVEIDEETMRSIVKEKVAEFELDIKSIKAEAIKEFAERLKANSSSFQMYDEPAHYIVTIDGIDYLVKEMVGDAE